ncbi:MAG: flagellar hook protein FlgE [Proteobacteria bacterium]|nr:flagellar hook protein FlgE [Pseudomonadota bacterium]
MPFNIALSGLTASSTELDIIANNIANAQTTGFKGSRAEFADVYAAGAKSLNTGATGDGVRLADTAQQFKQGNITSTNSNLDLAISGDGFFTLKGADGYVYSRNGAFSVDKVGDVVSSTGRALQVYPPLATGGFNTGALTNLNLQTSQSQPNATATGTVIVNLPANAAAPAAAPFDPTNAQTYTNSTTTAVYDSLGNQLNATFYFIKTATPNQWQLALTIDGTQVGAPQALQFSSTGALTVPAGGSAAFAPYNPTNGANPLNLTFDFSKTTQYGSSFGVNSITQDGYATGQLSNVAIDNTGVVSVVFSNGRSTQLGQLAIGNFPNPQGLRQLGDTAWSETFASGNVVLGQAASAGFGQIQSGALEQSNVDLTTQLVDMITAQRGFQANAQMITTADQITQTIINIR